YHGAVFSARGRARLAYVPMAVRPSALACPSTRSANAATLEGHAPACPASGVLGDFVGHAGAPLQRKAPVEWLKDQVTFNLTPTGSCLRVHPAGADQEDEDDRHEGDSGESAEGDVERHLPVVEHAEAPVGRAAESHADEIHDSVARRAQL